MVQADPYLFIFKGGGEAIQQRPLFLWDKIKSRREPKMYQKYKHDAKNDLSMCVHIMRNVFLYRVLLEKNKQITKEKIAIKQIY